MSSPVSISTVPREARVHQGRRAGLVSRLVAAVLDVLLVLLLLTLVYVAVNAIVFLMRPRTFSLLTASQPVLLALAALAMTTYLAGSWWAAGRTCGCDVMGLRIVDRRAQPPRLVVAVLRATLYVLCPLGVLWCASGSRRS